MCGPDRRASQRGDNKPPRGAQVPCAKQCRGVFRALLCAAAGGAQDREEPGLEGVLEHGCGSGRSDSRPLRASGPGTRGWRASGRERLPGQVRNVTRRTNLLSRSAPSSQRFLAVGVGAPGFPARLSRKGRETEREREIVPTPYLLILGGMSSGIQAVWPLRVAVLFQFGRSLLRDQRALSGKPMFWQPYRCTTPGC